MKSPRDSDRVRLLACIPAGLIATDKAQEILATVHELPEREIEPIITVETSRYTETDFLAEQGVDTESRANTALRYARDAASAYISGDRNQTVARKTQRLMLPALKALRVALRDPLVSEEQSWFGWDTLMQACESLALTPDLPRSALAFVRSSIEDGLRAPGSKYDTNFDEHGSWGGPAHHVSAATAAMHLYSVYPGEGAARLVELAAVDTFRPARARVAHLLPRLCQNNATMMWRIADSFAGSDPSAGVLERFVGASLGWLFHIDAAHARRLLTLAYDRAVQNGWPRVREHCESLFLWRALLDEPEATEIISGLIEQRKSHPETIGRMLFELRSHVRSSNSTIRSSAVRLLNTMATLFMSDYAGLSSESPASPTEEQQAVGKNLVELATEIYFASGAYGAQSDSSARPTDDDTRLFDELCLAFDQLRPLGIPAAVHKLLETLEYFIEARPDRVFDLSAAYIESGSSEGFQYEYVGAELAVRMMETFLTTQRNVIESTRERRKAFVRVLDAFVLWPSAVRLIYRFDEAFR